MVFQNPGQPGESQLQRHAISHLPDGLDPVLVPPTNADDPDGQIVLHDTATWPEEVWMPLGTAITTYGAEAVEALAAAAVAAADRGDLALTSVLTLFRYAFTRLDFLEEALKVRYGPRDIHVPEELELLEGII